jgi:uncharacterized membrane protein YgcG
MRKTWLAVAVTIGMIFPACVWAQGMGGPRGSRRNDPKFRLSGLMRGIGELERGKKAALNKAQAKRIVAAVRPWQNKPRMAESEAKSLYMKMNAVLTTRQKNELDKMAAQNRRFGGGENGRAGGAGAGGAGGGRMGGGFSSPGGGAPSAAQMQQMRQRMQSFFKTYNPFYPPGKYKELNGMPDRMQGGFKRRYQEQQALLSQLAKKAR